MQSKIKDFLNKILEWIRKEFIDAKKESKEKGKVKTEEKKEIEVPEPRRFYNTSFHFEDPTFPIEYLVIHHSETVDQDKADYIAIREYHMKEKRWNDIGYHFLIERINDRYEIIKGRPMDKPGAHARDGRMNNKSLGICLVGNFDLIIPPHEQIFLAQSLVRDLQKVTKIPSNKVIGHREVQEMARVSKKKKKDLSR